MIDILSPTGLDVLAEAARQRFAVALDFDGTLAPLVDKPDDARMRDHTRGLLRVLSLLCPCAVISGRIRADVAGRLGCPTLAAVVGNHGAETSGAPPPAVLRARVSAWAVALREATDPDEIQVEDKGFTLALHYRQARAREQTRSRLWSLAWALPGTKLIGGHAVVNVLPDKSPTKADAIVDFVAQYPGRPVVFVGDDEVDEDAFAAPVVTLPIRVGHHPESEAGYFVRDQGCVDSLLRELIVARRRADGVGEEWLHVPSKDGGSAG